MPTGIGLKEVDHKEPIKFIVGEQWLTGDEGGKQEGQVSLTAICPSWSTLLAWLENDPPRRDRRGLLSS